MIKLLNKKEIINKAYEVQFFLNGNDFFQKYRVKSNNGNILSLKLFNSSKLSKDSFSNNNLLEVEILAQLNDKKLQSLIDNGEFIKNNQRFHYIVTEFISGETIEDKLKRDSVFSEYAAVPIIIELLEGLKALHQHPKVIIHNNINPKAITLDYSENKETPVITGFEFARYISSKSNSLNTKYLSPFHSATEHFNGIFTPQSDIYSVGALLFNMLTGIPPWYVELPKFQFTEEKFVDSVIDKRNEKLSFGLKGFQEEIDEHLKITIVKALSHDVDERFNSCDEFIKALKREVVIDGEKKTNSQKPKVLKKKGSGFNSIAGMNDLKDTLYNDVIRALNEKERFAEYEIPIPNGMLLYGPPGCGKTYISEKFAEEVNFNFIKIIPSDIASIYVHGTQDKIGQVFKEAEKNAPSIIFFDEIEAMIPTRGGDTHESRSSEVNEFLAQMNNCGERGIFVIAATNRPDIIDPAFLRAGRIDYKIYLPPPDFEARKGLFKIFLKNKPVDIDVDFDELAKKTKNYVSVDIKSIIDFSARKAEKEDVRISRQIIFETIMEREPSLSEETLNDYELLKDRLSTRKQVSNNKPKFGF
ncbi:MAG: AAA family ATPase [Melioribacteraceae bacterium]|nr:AAA family ATPase [Melioribacteraceae bacterium]